MDRFFGITAQGSTLRVECLAGLTTFLTMAYILFVNPLILGAAGMDPGAVFVATCLASAFGSALMGLYANYPIALACVYVVKREQRRLRNARPTLAPSG